MPWTYVKPGSIRYASDSSGFVLMRWETEDNLQDLWDQLALLMQWWTKDSGWKTGEQWGSVPETVFWPPFMHQVMLVPVLTQTHTHRHTHGGFKNALYFLGSPKCTIFYIPLKSGYGFTQAHNVMFTKGGEVSDTIRCVSLKVQLMYQ